jgi:LPXTG-motif cell wall-anchored protein
LGSATADANGTVVETVTIPATIEPGVHTIEMEGQTSGVTVSTEIEVVAPEAAPGAPSTLPATGSATGELAGLGVALVAFGTASLVAGRRRLAARIS